MGLLDDAIREHLELKRRRGADPGEVAHEAQEALGAMRPDSATQGSDEAVGQETVEINMESVLEGDHDAENPEGPRAESSSSDAAATHAESGDSLEWEMPGDQQSKEHSDDADQDLDDPDHVEDVLEETPDF